MRKLRNWTLAAAVAAGALLIAFARPAPAPLNLDYRVVRFTGIDISKDGKTQDAQAAQLQDQLNGYAAEGWELAFVQDGVAVLRRGH